MYSLKLAHLVKERTGAEVYNFYIDMRTPGKGYEEFYNRLLEEGVFFIRGRVAEVTDWAIKTEEEGKLVLRVEDTMIGQVRRIPVEHVDAAAHHLPRAELRQLLADVPFRLLQHLLQRTVGQVAGVQGVHRQHRREQRGHDDRDVDPPESDEATLRVHRRDERLEVFPPRAMV